VLRHPEAVELGSGLADECRRATMGERGSFGAPNRQAVERRSGGRGNCASQGDWLTPAAAGGDRRSAECGDECDASTACTHGRTEL
jgi:hypothetical protein